MRKQLLLIIISVTIAVLIFEIILRLVGFSFPYYMRIDPVTGFSLRPEAEGYWQDEGKAHFKVNHDGFRDKLYSKEKADGVIRVAVLGDSYTEARHVNAKNAYWSIMENELNTCAGKEIEVLNFGMSGFSTAQEYLLLKHIVWDYQPDIVLLSFLSGNDVRENSKALNNVHNIPYFFLDGSELKLDESFKDTKEFKSSQKFLYQGSHLIVNNFRTMQMINKIKISARNQRLMKELGINKEDEDAKRGDPGLDTEIYSDPPAPEWEEAWRITEEIIKKMNEEVKSHNSKFVIVTLTNGVQVKPENKADLNYPERRIGKLGESINVPVITLAPKFLTYAKTNNTYLHGFDDSGEGHWNVEGNRLAGELIAKEMCNILY
ncbi:MAG: SGNH/GDSL hydrolase family protein [Candidatus Peribacteraceae bacterium]|jgi:hypothetical protein|nr:SGNH/GDSL hydrolase family protein [Candidatus Peribacteraceae bacterium]|tara:strand:+ start:3883 stop:5010 length:1128 start_codon:yes stop_codon:yes gene_type:complete